MYTNESEQSSQKKPLLSGQEEKDRFLDEVKRHLDADMRVRERVMAGLPPLAVESPIQNRSLEPEPEFFKDLKNLDPNRPLLDQLEEFVNGLEDEEYAQGFAWLEKNIYSNPKAMSVLTPFVVA